MDGLMVRVFFQLYGFLFCGALAVFAIQLYLSAQVTSQVGTGNLRERFRPTYQLMEELLRPLPADQWNGRFNEVAGKFPFLAELVATQELDKRFAMSELFRSLLAADKILVFEGNAAGGMTLVKRLGESDKSMILHLQGQRPQGFITAGGYLALQLAVFAVIMGLWVKPFWRDLSRLNAGAKRVGEGQFGERVLVGKRSPLAPLADSLNATSARVASLLRSHKNLTDAAAHEFRTPLTRLHFRYQMAKEGGTLEEKDRQLDLMESSLDQLDELSSELMIYSKYDREKPVLQKETIATTALLEPLMEEAADHAKASGKTVRLEQVVRADAIAADVHHLSRAVGNLLRNAVRYAATSVVISVERTPGSVVIHVDDDGPGIPEHARREIFLPFARLEEARDKESGGFGFGLAIVSQVAEWHDGSAQAGLSPLGGARLSVEIAQ
jgi:signal transduction histidine kinase